MYRYHVVCEETYDKRFETIEEVYAFIDQLTTKTYEIRRIVLAKSPLLNKTYNDRVRETFHTLVKVKDGSITYLDLKNLGTEI